MGSSAYYETLKVLARQVREKYDLLTPRVLRSDMRRIYRGEGIHLDLWPYKTRQLRGAYFNDDMGASVMLAKQLPDEPAIFTMGHELKHHLVDNEQVMYYCADSNVSATVEIGAEVFAAELIFPEADFAASLAAMGVAAQNFLPDHLVHLKRATRTTLSYAGLTKRAEFLGFATRGSLADVKWKKLEEALYGEPLYKRLPGYLGSKSARAIRAR